MKAFRVDINDHDEHDCVWALREESDPKGLTLNTPYDLVDPDAEVEMVGELVAFDARRLVFAVDWSTLKDVT